MMLLLQGNLPVPELNTAKQSFPTVRSPGHEHRAWQHAMEQAQLADWFKPGMNPRQERVPATHALATPVSVPMTEPDTGLPANPASFVLRKSSPEAGRSPATVSENGFGRNSLSSGTASPSDLLCDPTTRQRRPFDSQSTRCALHEDGSAPLASTGLFTALSVRTEIASYLSDGIQAQPPIGSQPKIPVIGPASALLPAGSISKPETISTRPPQLVAPSTPPRSFAPVFGSAIQMQVLENVAVDAEAPMVKASRDTAIKSVTADEPQPPIRIHVDFSEQGVRIWLGVSHQASILATGLAKHLDQWLATGGIKLAAFVCNGRPVYTRYPAARSFE
jgi:hypothetical protein